MNKIKNILELTDMKFHRCFWVLLIMIAANAVISAIMLAFYGIGESMSVWVIEFIFYSIYNDQYIVDYFSLVTAIGLFLAVFLVERSDIKFVAAYRIGRTDNAVSNIAVAFAVSLTVAFGVMASSLINIALMRIGGGYWITPLMNGEIAKNIFIAFLFNTMVCLFAILFIQFIVSIYSKYKIYITLAVILIIVATVFFSVVIYTVSRNENDIYGIIYSKTIMFFILLCANILISLLYIVNEKYGEVRR